MIRHMMASARNWRSVDEFIAEYSLVTCEEMPKINNAFGFISDQPCRMYAGRGVREPSPSWLDVQQLNSLGISFCVTMSGHFLDEPAFNECCYIVDRLLSMSEDNHVVLLNRTLAKRLRKTFPTLLMKQSAIADPKTPHAIERALEIYDLVTLSHTTQDDVEMITSLPVAVREKLVLFLVGGCAYRCEAKTCYTGNSEEFFKGFRTHGCTGKNRERGTYRRLTESKWWSLNESIFDYVQHIKLTENVRLAPMFRDIRFAK